MPGDVTCHWRSEKERGIDNFAYVAEPAGVLRVCDQLAAAYHDAERWGRQVVEERAPSEKLAPASPGRPIASVAAAGHPSRAASLATLS